MRFVFAFLVCTLAASSAFAQGLVGGTVSDSTNGGSLVGMEVTLWHGTSKGYLIADTTLTDAAGGYAFSAIAPGAYKVHTRMPPGLTGDWGDRWYDVVAPITAPGGYVPADADLLVVATTESFLGTDIALQHTGGIDARVTLFSGGASFVGMQAIGELRADPRVHHNDVSQAPPREGIFQMRGLVPGDYRILLHAPNGDYETIAFSGPYAVVPSAILAVGDLGMSPMMVDPAEPNDLPGGSGSAIDSSTLRTSPGVFVSSNALIGPRNGDIDWYCFDAENGDRYNVHASSRIVVEGTTREDPWVDPIVSLWSIPAVGPFLRVEDDDDSGPGARDALLDTGELGAGRFCVAVSTYGDSAFLGTGQGSAGRYDLRIAMGNRRPILAVNHEGSPVSATIMIDEGSTIALDAVFSDPDGDALTATAAQLDAAGNGVTGTFVAGAGTATYSWTAGQTAARGSPYVVTVRVEDGELAASTSVTVVVRAVNNPPTTPTPLAPADRATVATATPALVIGDSTDIDLDVLTYDFEIYYDAATGTPHETAVGVVAGGSGQTTYATAVVPENTWVYWRVRADDGATSASHSPWSAFRSLFVDVRNDPPAAPALNKPADGEELIVLRATLAAQNPVDPEGDAVTVTFDVASDAGFTHLVATSPAVAVSTTGPTTTWTMTAPLAWGGRYFARVRATDARGGISPYSNVNAFTLKANFAPTVPTLGAPFAAQCAGATLGTAPTSVAATMSVDPELEQVSLQLQIFDFSADPTTATPLYDRTEPQGVGATTTFDVSGTSFAGHNRFRVRVRAHDGVAFSDWSECDFTLVNPDAGASGTGGSGGPGGKTAAGGGCGCSVPGPGSSAGVLFVVALLGICLRRCRRR